MLKSLRCAGVVVFLGLGFASASSVSAQVRYAPRGDSSVDFFSPRDESFGVSPSYQVYPFANGGAAVRVIERCQYPDGWNVTDFGRDLNGIPNDASHTCRTTGIGGRVRARY